MSDTTRLTAALADRYRLERAATYVAARHTIAARFNWSRIFVGRYSRGEEILQ